MRVSSPGRLESVKRRKFLAIDFQHPTFSGGSDSHPFYGSDDNPAYSYHLSGLVLLVLSILSKQQCTSS